MNDVNKPLGPEDYAEPACLLCGEPYGAEPALRAVPQQRIIEKLDEYMSRRDYAGAERHLLYWMEEARLGRDLRGQLMLSNELIGHYRKTGDREKALRWVDEALRLLRTLDFEGSVSAGTTYVNAATACSAFGENERALALFEKAREIYESLPDVGAQLLGGHSEALFDRGRVQVGEDRLLRYEYADDRADGIHGLREVEPAYRALRVAQREHARVGRRLEYRAAARNDEYADKVEVEALMDARRYVENRSAYVHRKADEYASAERELLDEYRREERQHRVCAVERDLHEHGAVLVHGEDALERRHEIVGHVVDEPPQRKAEDKQEERQPGVLHEGPSTFHSASFSFCSTGFE